MKAELIKIKSRTTFFINKVVRDKCNQAGISTLEMLIALALITVSITSATVITFGNQSISVDNETNNQALFKAQAAIEKAKADSRQDFNSVNSESRILENIGEPYFKEFKVSDISPCLKEISSIYDWAAENNRHPVITLTTRLSSTSTLALLGGDCATSPPPGLPPGTPSGGWAYPDGTLSLTFSNAQGTDLEVIDDIVYTSTESPSIAKEDFFITRPPYTDAELTGIDAGGYGINSIDAVKNGDGNIFVYAANNKTSEQFLVINATNALTPSLIAARDLPDVSLTGPNPEGRSIFYYDKKIYIGTYQTTGPEFHVYNVSNPHNPVHLGYKELNINVNAITVTDQTIGGVTHRFAYLATSGNSTELLVLDVTNPAAIVQAASKDLPGNEDGRSIYYLGNKIFLGRYAGNTNPNFYALDVKDPLTGIDILGSIKLGGNTADINDFRVVGYMAFLATAWGNNEFIVLNVENLPTIQRINGEKCPNLPNIMSALYYYNNRIFCAFRSNDVMKIIDPGADSICN